MQLFGSTPISTDLIFVCVSYICGYPEPLLPAYPLLSFFFLLGATEVQVPLPFNTETFLFNWRTTCRQAGSLHAGRSMNITRNFNNIKKNVIQSMAAAKVHCGCHLGAASRTPHWILAPGATPQPHSLYSSALTQFRGDEGDADTERGGHPKLNPADFFNNKSGFITSEL